MKRKAKSGPTIAKDVLRAKPTLYTAIDVRDLKRINKSSRLLNREALDVLNYQFIQK